MRKIRAGTDNKIMTIYHAALKHLFLHSE